MPLQHFFEEQTRALRIFLNTKGPRLRVLLTDPDTKEITYRWLAGMENDERVPHLFISSNIAFTGYDAYFKRVYGDLLKSYEQFGKELAAGGVPPPPAWDTIKGTDPAERFMRGARTFARALPFEGTRLAIFLDPTEVADPVEYRRALRWLAENTNTNRLKYVVLDDRLKGHTAELVKELPDIRAQSTFLSPDEMERRVDWAVKTGIGIGDAERRVYTGMQASFAFSRRDYDKALDLQKKQLAMTAETGTPGDLASIHYNLGNTHLARKDLTAAIESFSEGLRLAMEANSIGLLPLILTNLGMALFQAEAREQGTQCFEAARVYCQKRNQLPIEAHVLDCQARGNQVANRPDEAEKCWKEALALFNKITAEPFRFVRDAGRADILTKLERHYQATRQKDKLAALQKEAAHGSA